MDEVFDGPPPTVDDIVASIPEDASMRVLSPQPGQSQAGLEFKWTDEDGIVNRVRLHDPDPSAPRGSNSSDGWTVRWQRRGGYYDPTTGDFAHRQAHNPNSPNFDPASANNTHIPMETPADSTIDLMRRPEGT